MSQGHSTLKDKVKKPRNSYVLAMTLRYCNQKFKDKRQPKGGNKNIQQQYLEEYFEFDSEILKEDDSNDNFED